MLLLTAGGIDLLAAASAGAAVIRLLLASVWAVEPVFIMKSVMEAQTCMQGLRMDMFHCFAENNKAAACMYNTNNDSPSTAVRACACSGVHAHLAQVGIVDFTVQLYLVHAAG